MKKENEEKIKEAKDAIEKTKKKQGKFFKEFKEFALRGNVLDLAVGVLIGSAFQSVVTSFTNNIISPILGCFGGVNFSEWVLEIGKLRLTYGAFLTDIINFLIMAFVIFILVKVMKVKKGSYDAYLIPESVEEFSYTKDGKEIKGFQYKFKMEFPQTKGKQG